MPKLGILAYASNNGLGVQTAAYHKWLKPAKVLVANISHLNGQDVYLERYPRAIVSHGYPTGPDIDKFLTGLDVVLVAENPLSYYLYEAAKERGIRTVNHYNFEFCEYFNMGAFPKPDLMLAPSLWRAAEMRDACVGWGCDWSYLPMPVDRMRFPYRQRSQAKTFLHIVGHTAAEDRNGTQIVLDAIKHVNSDVQFIIRSQDPLPKIDDKRVKVVVGDLKDNSELYDQGDVLLFPRRYGGQSLVLNEALSCGMIPVMSNIPPQSDFLEPISLLRAEQTGRLMARMWLDVFSVDPKALARRIDHLANAPTENVMEWSAASDHMASRLSWEVMLPHWESMLKEVCAAPAR